MTYYIILHNTAIIIGFDPDSYNVNETDNTVTLIVRLIEGKISEEKSIRARITTADDSAQGKLETMKLYIKFTDVYSATVLICSSIRLHICFQNCDF